jgi:hypothetical protein
LPMQLHDTVKLRYMQADSTYCRCPTVSETGLLNVQTWMVDHRGSWYGRPR